MSDSRPLLAFALEYPLGMGGGVSVLVRELIRGLQSRYRIALVSPDTREDLASAGVEQSLAEHLHWTARPLSRNDAHELSRAIARWNPIIAHFHSGGNFGWGNRLPGHSPIPHLNRGGVECVSTVHLVVSPLHGVCPPNKSHFYKAGALLLSTLGKLRMLRHAAMEIAVSEHDLRLLRRWYPIYRKRLVRIYHSALHEGSLAEEGDRDRVILNVGHRAHRKGQPVLAEAFSRIAARHPNWKLVMVGPTGEPDCDLKIREIVARAGIERQVELLGDEPNAAARMSRAAIYVQPSLHEALGLALQEALFHGCACIGTNAGGIPELISNDENGLLVETGSAESLARALERVILGDDLRKRFRRAGPSSVRAKGMTAERMIAAHLALYERITRR